MFDLKVINAVLDQLEDERGIPRTRVIEAIEASLASAYKKEFGKRGQIIKAIYNTETGDVQYEQVKTVVDENTVQMDVDEEAVSEEMGEEELPHYNPEQHIMIDAARLMKRDAQVGEEIVFPLEHKEDFGRIAAQTAKQVILQKIREAERASVFGDYADKEGEVVAGTVQRFERGNLYVDLGRTTGIIPYNEQIPGERFRPGDRVRALLFSVDEGGRGVFLKLSRSHPKFLMKLFEQEAPEVANGVVEVKAVAREAGARSKIAVYSNDEYVDPVGSLVGQRGVRVSTVTSELGGEKIDIIEWSEDPIEFIEEALSPARVQSVELNEDDMRAIVTVAPDQQSLAIGKGGQNVRLAAKLTGWKIDILSTAEEGELAEEAHADDMVTGDALEEESLAEDVAAEAFDEAPTEVIEDSEEAQEGDNPEENISTEEAEEMAEEMSDVEEE